MRAFVVKSIRLCVDSAHRGENVKKPNSMMKAALEFARAFGKWVAVALVTGLVCGLVGSAFYASVASATEL